MIKKISFRNQVKSYLQNQMLEGKISFGDKLTLPSIAQELDISVTPIREALSQLQQVNIVESIPNRGFFLPKMSNKEASEIYPVIAHLEHLAISSSVYSKESILKLKNIQLAIEQTDSAREIVIYDLRFHKMLLEEYDNNTLKQILGDLKLRVLMYEFYYMKNSDLSALSSSYHNRVISNLELGKTNSAADLIKESWLTSIDFIEKNFS